MNASFLDNDNNYIISKENLTKLSKTYFPQNATNNYIGDSDAVYEWEKDKNLARHMFLHTDAYHEFLNDNSLILLGRTGTGKTAIMLSAEDDARKKNEHGIRCSSVISISCQELIINLANCEELSEINQTTTTIKIKKIIKMFINSIVMKSIFENATEDEKKTSEIKVIKDYLERNGFIDKKIGQTFINSFLKVASVIETDNPIANNTLKVTSSILKIIDTLTSRGYENAIEAMQKYMSERERILVLIDSLNEYDVNKKDIVLIVKGLIDVCFHYYNHPNNKILMKIALPSEIYNKVLIRLPSKQVGNTVVIRWKYKEIIVLLALRIYACYKTKKYKELDFCKEFNDYTDFYYDINPKAYENSIKLLNNILPISCPTSLSFDFLTLPYCIRHTLKKPREIIFMFNKIIEQIVKNKNSKFLLENPNRIKDIVHSTQDYMISSALSMYQNSYSGIYAAVESLFNDNDFVFTGKTITDKLKEAIQAAKKETENILTPAEHLNADNSYEPLDEYSLSQILLESGLVGEITKKSVIIENRMFENNNKSICILTANFDFVISATTRHHVFKNDVQYALHPMCYENYGCNVDKYTLVYPNGFTDDGDVVIDTITAK